MIHLDAFIKALSLRCPAAAYKFFFFFFLHNLKTLSLGILYSLSSMDKFVVLFFFLFFFVSLKFFFIEIIIYNMVCVTSTRMSGLHYQK